jgi:hypothetical protein
MKDFLKKRRTNSILGLALDGNRLEGVVLRRSNGSVQIVQTFVASLALNPLTGDPELVGREIRNHLEAAEIRERHCVVGVPLSWALTLQAKLPDLPEADLHSFLQIEAERGFPYGVESLMISQSRVRASDSEQYATLVAIPRDHVTRLENVLRAAQLRPVSFSLGIAALQGAEGESADGVLALVPGENSIALQITGGGGVAVLRTLEHAFETEGSEKRVQADHIAREIRITLGQLPPEVRAVARRLRVFGHNDAADELTEQLRPRVESLNIQVEQVRDYSLKEFDVHLPKRVPVSEAFSLALRYLAERKTGFEFLPPRVTAWQQIAARYSSGKLAWAGATGGAVAALIALAFFVQQCRLWYWQSKWSAMSARVTELDSFQQQIRKYRPWFDESFRSLSVLRRLTEAFPEDGTVSVKIVEIREPATITCSGTARDPEAFLKTIDQLRAAKEIKDVQVKQSPGKQSPGKPAMEFTFDFHWAPNQ